ncbi:hypothetical protein SEA_VANLEE_15 [Gordonia phage VanLee]|uniref:Uncharacterized protein n=1 Tax=Gordonia phage VanLee TaxID=2845816 RepID=A0A8F2IFC0_9CAUD|nr:hypothetical protein QEH49_gp015 [Gordonia phage VanLee]QWS68133.1 hypothetical protein SEA_VANLEE_15 [Gordonia phage VanLee]
MRGGSPNPPTKGADMSNFDLPVTLVSPKGREEVVDNFERANNLVLACGYSIKPKPAEDADEADSDEAADQLSPNAQAFTESAASADKGDADKADTVEAPVTATTPAPKTAAKTGAAKPKDDTK